MIGYSVEAEAKSVWDDCTGPHIVATFPDRSDAEDYAKLQAGRSRVWDYRVRGAAS